MNGVMEIKKGEKTYNVPQLVLIAGILTIGGIATDICKTVMNKHNVIGVTKKEK